MPYLNWTTSIECVHAGGYSVTSLCQNVKSKIYVDFIPLTNSLLHFDVLGEKAVRVVRVLSIW